MLLRLAVSRVPARLPGSHPGDSPWVPIMGAADLRKEQSTSWIAWPMVGVCCSVQRLSGVPAAPRGCFPQSTAAAPAVRQRRQREGARHGERRLVPCVVPKGLGRVPAPGHPHAGRHPGPAHQIVRAPFGSRYLGWSRFWRLQAPTHPLAARGRLSSILPFARLLLQMWWCAAAGTTAGGMLACSFLGHV